MLEPALREGVESGELRLVFVLTNFEGLEPGAWIEDGLDEEGLGRGLIDMKLGSSAACWAVQQLPPRG